MIGADVSQIRLVSFDRNWEEAGRRAASEIRRALGSSALSVEHIGSTSIRFASAIPILDLIVGCPSTVAVSDAIAILRESGYTPLPDAPGQGGSDVFGGPIFYFLSPDDGKTVLRSVRVTVRGSREWEDCIAFRAYLTGRPDVAREYHALKNSLAAKYPRDPAAYNREKAEWIAGVLTYARHWRWLGNTVTVKVDRPMGSTHPDRPDIVYPVNCGYPRDLTFPGVERLGVYILGINHPVHLFTGRVIAIIFRRNGEGVRWVVAPSGREIDQAEILSSVWFRERDFPSDMEHLFHRSVGMVVYQNIASGYRFLLLRESRSQGWSIPKGHMEYGETELETAIREVREETGLDCQPIPGFRREVSYPIPPIYRKTLIAFLAPTTSSPVIQPEEISEYRWVTLPEANRLLGGRRFAELINAAAHFLREKDREKAEKANRE